MPKIIMGVMSKMMARNMKMDGTMMPQMMTRMMPNCLRTMLPAVPKEERANFVMEMVSVLVDQGSSEMTDEERKVFLSKIAEKVNT